MATLELSRIQPPSKEASRRVPNSEILGSDSTHAPSLPTIRDLEFSELTTKKEKVFVRGVGRLLDTAVKASYLPNGGVIGHIRLARHIRSDLADPLPLHHDVYLVTRISPTTKGKENSTLFSRGSTSHWSFYCHGHYYHLSAPGLPGRIVNKSQQTTAGGLTTSRLRHDDLSSEYTDDYKRLASIKSPALIAYKVGQTDYSQEQVLRLAEWIISRLPEYGLFTANCQHFAIGLMARTVMRLCDRSIFAGTAIQLAQWDRGGSSAQEINKSDVGFLIGPPLPLRPNLFQELVLDLKALSGTLRRCHPHPDFVARMYRDGEDIFPDFYYQLRRSRRDFLEIKEDLMQKRWKNVFLGRLKEQPDGTFRRAFPDPSTEPIGCYGWLKLCCGIPFKNAHDKRVDLSESQN